MFEFIKTLKNWTICLFLWVCHILFRKVEKAPIDVVSSESVCKSTIQSDNYQNSEHSGDPSNLICNKENNKEAKDEDNRENVKIKPIVHSGTDTQGPNEKEQIVELPQGENNSSSSTAHIDQADIQNVTNSEINTTQEEEREQRTWNDSDRKLDRKRRFHSTNEQLNFDSNLPQIEREEAMKEFEYFWKSHSPFSQWYLSDFTLYSITFNCAEQHMMYQKAMLFGDEETAHKVLQEKEPREQKKLGRLVKNFDQEKWNKNCLKIVESGNRAKFLQNEDLKEEFLKTYPKTFVEASPYDTIWGIGLEDDDPRAWNRGTWRGQNLLGKALTKVRDEFMKVDTDLNDFSFSHNETIGNQEDISDNEFVNEKKPINDVNTDEENKEDYSRSNNSVRITNGVHPAVMIKTESILMTKDSSDFDKTQNDDDMIRENAKQNEDISTEKESCLHNRKEKITETKEKEDEATRNVSFLDIDGKTIREKGLASEEPIGSLNFFNEKNLNKTERVIENEDISTSDESNQDSTNSEKENMNKTKENTQRIGSLKTEKENVIETTQKTDEFTEKDSCLEINELKENDLTSDESTKITGRFDSMLTNKLVAIKSMSTSDESDLKNTENYSLQETPHSKVDSTLNKSITESSDYPNRNIMFSETKRSHAEPFVEKNEKDTCDSTVETPGSTQHQKEMVEDNTLSTKLDLNHLNVLHHDTLVDSSCNPGQSIAESKDDLESSNTNEKVSKKENILAWPISDNESKTERETCDTMVQIPDFTQNQKAILEDKTEITDLAKNHTTILTHHTLVDSNCNPDQSISESKDDPKSPNTNEMLSVTENIFAGPLDDSTIESPDSNQIEKVIVEDNTDVTELTQNHKTILQHTTLVDSTSNQDQNIKENKEGPISPNTIEMLSASIFAGPIGDSIVETLGSTQNQKVIVEDMTEVTELAQNHTSILTCDTLEDPRSIHGQSERKSEEYHKSSNTKEMLTTENIQIEQTGGEKTCDSKIESQKLIFEDKTEVTAFDQNHTILTNENFHHNPVTTNQLDLGLKTQQSDSHNESNGNNITGSDKTCVNRNDFPPDTFTQNDRNEDGIHTNGKTFSTKRFDETTVQQSCSEAPHYNLTDSNVRSQSSPSRREVDPSQEKNEDMIGIDKQDCCTGGARKKTNLRTTKQKPPRKRNKSGKGQNGQNNSSVGLNPERQDTKHSTEHSTHSEFSWKQDKPHHNTKQNGKFDNLPNKSREDAKKMYEFFWKSQSPYSQWYFCNFTVGGVTFNCAEQYMMYSKAELFDDRALAEDILKEQNPRKQNKLGRMVRNFNKKKWDENCLEIVKRGNRAKFSQNQELNRIILKTYPRTIVEASPHDKIWGIGVDEYDSRAWNKETWRGKNLLGQVLTEVRNELKLDKERLECAMDNQSGCNTSTTFESSAVVGDISENKNKHNNKTKSTCNSNFKQSPGKDNISMKIADSENKATLSSDTSKHNPSTTNQVDLGLKTQCPDSKNERNGNNITGNEEKYVNCNDFPSDTFTQNDRNEDGIDTYGKTFSTKRFDETTFQTNHNLTDSNVKNQSSLSTREVDTGEGQYQDTRVMDRHIEDSYTGGARKKTNLRATDEKQPRKRNENRKGQNDSLVDINPGQQNTEHSTKDSIHSRFSWKPDKLHHDKKENGKFKNLPNKSRKDANKSYEFFWKSQSPYSQWYFCNFTVGGVTFNCAEQYMMYSKAELFGDREVAEDVLKEQNPREQKNLGRMVRNFNQRKWDENCLEIVKRGNRAKFSQNPELNRIILKTYPRTIAEASPHDKIWGIGVGEYDPRAWNIETWRGKNLLGQALTEVRNELKFEKEHSEFAVDNPSGFETSTTC